MSAQQITFRGLLLSSFAAIRGNYEKAFAIIVVFFFINVTIKWFNVQWLAIFMLPLQMGMLFFFLRVARGSSPGVGVIFEPSRKYWHYLWVILRPGIFIVLWGLFLIIPGIIATLRYGMCGFIALDEPELSAREAMEKSSRMMKGHKLELIGYASLIWILWLVIVFGSFFIFLQTSRLMSDNELRDWILYASLFVCNIEHLAMMLLIGTFFAKYYLAVRAESNADALE